MSTVLIVEDDTKLATVFSKAFQMVNLKRLWQTMDTKHCKGWRSRFLTLFC